MNDLDTLLRAATDQAPPGHIAPDLLVRAGRSRVRRRRAVAGAAVVAVVGMLGGVAGLAGGDPDSTRHPAADPGQTLTLADAVDAQSGTDYQVLRTFTAHSTDKAMTGQFVRGVLTDGTIVVQSYPHGLEGASRITLVSTDGSQSVDAPRSLGNYLGATPTAALFGGNAAGGVWMLDTVSMGWSETLEGQELDLNTPVQPLSATPDRPTHIYFPDSAEPKDKRAIFEATLGERDGFELTQGGDVAAFGGRVAWTASYDAPNDRVVVRDLDTGEDTSFDPKTGDCVQKDLGLTATRVVVMVNCSDTAGDRAETDVVDRIDVFDLAGRPLARITGDELGPVRMTDRFLTISSWNKDQAGTYTYDLDTGRFLKVEASMSGLTGDETGNGSTLVWQQRLDGDSGATYVVAAMR